MPDNLKWHGPRVQAAIRAEMGRRLDAARILVQNHAKQLVGIDGTGTTGTGKKTKLVYGANPSKPGEAPRKQTGRLQGSIASEREGMVARIGTNYDVGLHLETGTVNMLPRPWLRRALAEMAAAVRALLTRPMK